MTTNRKGGRMSEPHTTTWTPWKLIGAIGSVAVALSIFPAVWTFSDHWMNRAEIEKAMKAHADNDARVQTWNQYGFASNRIEYLDDKQAECEAKKMMAGQVKLNAVDITLCTRYESKLKAKSAEAADLKAKAMEASKEK